MFRKSWDEIEEKISQVTQKLKNELIDGFEEKSQQWRSKGPFKDVPLESQEEFIAWGKEHVEKLKNKASGEKFESARTHFLTLVRHLGINESLLIETFNQNKKELLDPLLGEFVAIVCLVLGWKQKDKEAFSQALGEIGVMAIFASKPLMGLIAISGLAYGYNENFHKESFKKGGVLGLAGLTAAALTPGGFIGLLAAVVAVVYFNKKLDVERPIEAQLKEIFNHIKSGGFFSEVRESWTRLEDFLQKLFEKPEGQAAAT